MLVCAALALGPGCKYDPKIPEGVVSCEQPDDCPSGYFCSDDRKLCCLTEACGGAGAGDGSAADAPQVDAPSEEEDVAAPADRAPDHLWPDDPPPRAPDTQSADVTPIDGPPAPRDAPAERGGPCPAAIGGPALVPAGSFCIDATEVTNVQYDAFLLAKGSDLGGQPAACLWNSSYRPVNETIYWPYSERTRNHPVVNVDWCDAYMFCRWAGKRLCGRIGGGRLASWKAAARPAESQWTAACTGGSRTAYPYGGTFDRSACNLDAASESAATAILAVQSRARCEGGYPGIFDLSGNVMEWVDGCDRDFGRTDLCSSAGTSAWLGMLSPSDVTCSGSHYGAPRDDTYYFRGFRCCSD